MASRATRKPSVLCWLLAAMFGVVAMSLFAGTALWLGAGGDPAQFAVEAAIPAVVRVDDPARPSGNGRRGQKTRASETTTTTTTTTTSTTTTEPPLPPPDVTAVPEDIPAELQDTPAPEELPEKTPDVFSDDRQQVYDIPSGDLISLTKRGEDFQSPPPAAEDQRDDGFQPLEHRVPGSTAPEARGAHNGEVPDQAARHPALSFLRKKVHELHDWLDDGDSRLFAEFREVLRALDGSISAGDSAPLLAKLRQLYSRGPALAGLGDPAVVANTSSLVSFGLLAFDLLLLHNVQHVAWEEERLKEAHMLRDPEVLALNALFMPAHKVRALLEQNRRSGNVAGGSGEEEEGAERSLGEELLEFASGAVRGVLNLGRAYRLSAAAAAAAGGGASARRDPATPLDCVWTLYCRNLDHTSRLKGPYGFLAKMNSFGLRLVMGEFPVDRVLESAVKEFTLGWSRIDCQKLFPRCSVKDATSVVLKSVLHEEQTV